MQTVTLHIEGMTCGGCVKSVTRVLTEQAGVQKAEVSLENKQAVITFDESAVSVSQLKEVIEDAGYDVVDQ
ncbi:heavy-metal-associated domain-containing protein [Pelistega sp. NLN82]|uniref:Heavy-metal-associated domain-containing protein n=1 Tax=Pelistega ratti TaxID=2652177 RepID=A0A6L9Y7Z1_9BURK|nr:cation transporter [Pelistega ratti]NEN75977.1 heavy-metal-associated domain-containing protein [Pelistega ratti]